MANTIQINDLPQKTNGFEKCNIEVQTTGGTSYRVNLAQALLNAGKPIAGRYWDETLPNPKATGYFGNLDFLRNLPSFLGLGCYLVTDDRRRRKLDPANHYKFDDGSPARLDGSDGQYMWCWNEHYYASWKEGNNFYEAVSLEPIAGKECYHIPAGGTSALGNGVVDRVNGLLCSIINNDPQYRGGNNNADWDGTYRTLLGKPATTIAMTSFSTYARRRGQGWESQWYVSRAVQEYLFRIIMGTRNSYADFIAHNDSDGLYQGGLGPALTTVENAKWSAYNSNFPLVPCSAGVELADGVGVALYDIPAADGSVFHTAKIPVFFGLKNIYGNLWTGVRGLIIEAGPEVSSVYVAPSLYMNYSNTSVAGMIKAAETYRTSSYIKKISMNKLCCMPTEGSATKSTYYTEQHYAEHVRRQGFLSRLAGGSPNSGAATGAFVTNSNAAVAHSNGSVSGALCYFEEDPIIR